MLFYEACVSGELTFQTLGESPLADKMPPKMKNNILEATLKNDKLVLMGTDCVPQPGLVKGNSVSLNLHCSSEDEIKFFYEKLHAVGTATYPFQDTFGVLYSVG